MTSVKPDTIHCAIYTRKSSDEGLDQDFNSLDAQYEAATAYIGSQKHEGWRLLDKRYDDGGHSGGTMERPALERLLADINSGLVKMVVVYKIDRLTRSLADFARLVERMDKVGCSFVSVTQSFNTSTSMGRLTLNVLLSFAQFEREVTAERIRDKIAASKAKGMWMGGYPPLGYDRHPDDKVRSLVINKQEASHVRTIFDIYEATQNLASTEQQVKADQIRSKEHLLSSGKIRGGSVMSRGQIQSLLANPVYAGRIKHKEKVFDGLHSAIIEPDRWQRVQTLLQSNARKPRGKTKPASEEQCALHLRGKLADETDRQLTTTYTIKNGKRYHYYISKPPKDTTDPSTAWRLPVKRIEAIIQSAVADHLQSQHDQHRIVINPDANDANRVSNSVTALISAIKAELSEACACITNASLGSKTLTIKLDKDLLAKRIGAKSEDLDTSLLTFCVPLRTKKRGVETRIIAGSDTQSHLDSTLISTLQAAHRWLDALKQGQTLTSIAKSENRSETYIRTRISIALLSPKIQSAILSGHQPIELTTDLLARETMPTNWDQQAQKFGFSAD